MRKVKQQQFLERYGPWAIVTGASSGIGRAFVHELAQLGLKLVLVARNEETLQMLEKEIIASGGEARVIAADLSDASEVSRVHSATRSLDIGLLVASAGFGSSGSFTNSAASDELNMLDVNCRATVASSHHFGQRFIERGRGGLVLLSSIVSFQGNGSTTHYSATKAYVQSLAEGLNLELRNHGVDVLSVAPGPTASGFAKRAGMQLGASISPNTVARESLQALGRKQTILPGLLSKLLKHAMFGLPRSLRVRIMSAIMRKMVPST